MKQLKSLIRSLDNQYINSINLICGKEYQKNGIRYRFITYSDNWLITKIKIKLNSKTMDFVKRIENKKQIDAACDCLYREFFSCISCLDNSLINKSKGDSYTGRFDCKAPTDVILSNNYSFLDKTNGLFCAIFRVRISSSKGRINSNKTLRLLTQLLPNQLQKFVNSLEDVDVNKKLVLSVELVKDQQCIEEYLSVNNYIAFIGNGSKLIDTGIVSATNNCVLFQSPPEYEIELKLNNKCIKGMAIPMGLTTIIGGSYCGKTTFLNALSSAVYNYCLGSGREYVVVCSKTVSVSSEERRIINIIDLSLFYDSVPGGRDVARYYDNWASSCISQAANFIEAVQWGAKVLLIDEDKSAANFMWRDTIISSIIGKDIFTTFMDNIPFIVRELKISCIIVTGSNSQFIEMSDAVFLFEKFIVRSLNTMKSEYKSNRSQKSKQFRTHDIVIRDDNGKLLFEYAGKTNGGIKNDKYISIGDCLVDLRDWDTVIDRAQIETLYIFVDYICKQNYAKPVSVCSMVKKFINEFENNKINVNNFLLLPFEYDFYRLLNRIVLFRNYLEYRE